MNYYFIQVGPPETVAKGMSMKFDWIPELRFHARDDAWKLTLYCFSE
jgi:hypothetical protein